MIIEFGFSPDRSRQINPLAAGRGFGEGQPAAGPARPGELPPRPLGEQPTGPGTVVLEQPQAIPPARQAGPAQEPLHRCGGHGRRALASQVGGDPPAAPRGPRERHAQDPPFPGQGELARPAPAGLMSPGMQSIGPIALEARSPAIEQGAPDPARSCGPWPARSNADTEPRAAAAAGPSTAPEPLRGGRCPGGPTPAQRRGGVPRRCRQRLLRAEKRRRRGSGLRRQSVCMSAMALHGPGAG